MLQKAVPTPDVTDPATLPSLQCTGDVPFLLILLDFSPDRRIFIYVLLV